MVQTPARCEPDSSASSDRSRALTGVGDAPFWGEYASDEPHIPCADGETDRQVAEQDACGRVVGYRSACDPFLTVIGYWQSDDGAS